MAWLSAQLVAGQGAGHNQFTAEAGSGMFGVCRVQLVPPADTSLLELFGELTRVSSPGALTRAPPVLGLLRLKPTPRRPAGTGGVRAVG